MLFGEFVWDAPRDGLSLITLKASVLHYLQCEDSHMELRYRIVTRLLHCTPAPSQIPVITSRADWTFLVRVVHLTIPLNRSVVARSAAFLIFREHFDSCRIISYQSSPFAFLQQSLPSQLDLPGGFSRFVTAFAHTSHASVSKFDFVLHLGERAGAVVREMDAAERMRAEVFVAVGCRSKC